MFYAGTDSSAKALEWIMSELLRNPRILRKAQAEVRQVLNNGKKINEEEIQELKYLPLIIKESLRLHPATPLFTRESRETCEIDGHQIPEKARVIINLWAINRDEEYWKDAECFWPERFEGSSISYQGNNFEYLPFGAGRRMCPGISFANANIEHALASLLYHFDWKLPDGLKPEEVDMSEQFGASVGKKNALYVIATPATNV